MLAKVRTTLGVKILEWIQNVVSDHLSNIIAYCLVGTRRKVQLLNN